MNRPLKLILLAAPIAFALGACASASPGPVVTPPELRSVDEILSAYYSAIGGYQRLKAVNTRRMTGRYVENGVMARTSVYWRRPTLRRVNVLAPGWQHLEGYDGSTWEYHCDANQQAGSVSRPTGAADDAQRRGSEFDESFVDYRTEGHRAEFLGRQRLDDLDVHVVRILRKDAWSKDYYFDVHSHLLVALKKAMPSHARGPDVESLTNYSDWRFVGGLLWPFSGVERRVATGEVMATLEWDTIEFNVPIAEADLQPPQQCMQWPAG